MGDVAYRREILSVAFPELRAYERTVTWLSETFSSSVRDLLAAARTIKAYMGSQGREPEPVEMAALLGIDLSENHHRAAPEKRQPEAGNHLLKFKQMLDGAESEEEYYLAIQIAINTRLTELRRGEGNAGEIAKFERAMELVQRRELHEVMKLIGM